MVTIELHKNLIGYVELSLADEEVEAYRDEMIFPKL